MRYRWRALFALIICRIEVEVFVKTRNSFRPSCSKISLVFIYYTSWYFALVALHYLLLCSLFFDISHAWRHNANATWRLKYLRLHLPRNYYCCPGHVVDTQYYLRYWGHLWRALFSASVKDDVSIGFTSRRKRGYRVKLYWMIAVRRNAEFVLKRSSRIAALFRRCKDSHHRTHTSIMSIFPARGYRYRLYARRYCAINGKTAVIQRPRDERA